jgi:L-seryl-tRNA(Ser) seleniumtransferase
MNDLRGLPSVDQLITSAAANDLSQQFGRPLTVEAIRWVLGEIRGQHTEQTSLPSSQQILDLAHSQLTHWLHPTLVPVINASGVILHTNLGRAPLSQSAIEAVRHVAGSYNTLEFDLASGKRGTRSVHCEHLLQRLTGAEAALVVNNNAAAVLLALSALARRKPVVISRTQLVEIGGGFRIPDVMKQSGAKLLEIGTTNRVHLADYEQALESSPAMFLRAHPSNFRMIGFTAEPTLAEIVAVAHRAGIPMLDDLGSGTLLNTENYGLTHEPTIQESITAGADMVTFSGDKLLGGPQAGILVGRADLMTKIRKHPLARAVRADKMQLAALTATLEHYLKAEAEQAIPIWRMIAATDADCHERACRWKDSLGSGEIQPGLSTVGGGSLPGETLPTTLLALQLSQPNAFLARLRSFDPPIIARIENDQVVFDPRTVQPEEEGSLLSGIRSLHAGKTQILSR